MKVVKLSQVQELIKLYKLRDTFYEWSSEWARYNRKIKTTIEFIERNAKEVEEND
ncbi:hypothetical protein [Bacillus thuringiensis]|uniref:hypothetical protein n=1 Tax=Bacillus thuringiensis TaxID=1428 RepID=UPI00345A5BD6